MDLSRVVVECAVWERSGVAFAKKGKKLRSPARGFREDGAGLLRARLLVPATKISKCCRLTPVTALGILCGWLGSGPGQEPWKRATASPRNF